MWCLKKYLNCTLFKINITISSNIYFPFLVKASSLIVFSFQKTMYSIVFHLWSPYYALEHQNVFLLVTSESLPTQSFPNPNLPPTLPHLLLITSLLSACMRSIFWLLLWVRSCYTCLSLPGLCHLFKVTAAFHSYLFVCFCSFFSFSVL